MNGRELKGDSVVCLPDSLEPIDVKNWFSSYVYESPALDTNDGFKDSLNKESECEEDGFIVDESNREKAEGYVKLKRTTKRDGVESSNGLANCGNYSGNNQLEKQLLHKVLISLSFCSHFPVLYSLISRFYYSQLSKQHATWVKANLG